ncbi:hypothetical protein ACFLVX_05245 [Chloroflexota bacterium]
MKMGQLAMLVLVLALALSCTIQTPAPTPTPEPKADPTPNPEVESKAAIVDQLYTLKQNQTFIEQTTRYLEGYGFEVDLYQGNDVTVDLYRKLPTYGYKLIIFRVHSGLLGGEDVANRTWLFTSEQYSKNKYVTEQLTDKVTYAGTHPGSPIVYAIGAKFITESMKGQFSNTAVIMMGCAGLFIEDVAQALVQKGASTYMGWDIVVGLSYVDEATMVLVNKLCTEELAIAKAVSETMEEEGPDPEYGAVLRYYPGQSGDKNLRQLID